MEGISAPTKPKRKGISKKTRFEVFKRDGFKCMYCGAHPPSVLLHIDHVVPVAGGGKNDIDNLVTACEPCNLGKGARDLAAIPMSLSEKAQSIAEREEQLRGFHDVMQSKRNRLDDQAWQVIELLLPGAESVPRDWMNSMRMFIDKLGYHAVYEAMEIALAKNFYKDEKTHKYFCGVCWNRLREIDGA